MTLLSDLHPRILFVLMLTLFSGAGVSAVAMAQSPDTPYFSYPDGFADASALMLNGSAALQGNAIQLTDGKQFESGSFFYKKRVVVEAFVTSFDFQLTDANADGFAFVVQTLGPDALGSSGAGLGYGKFLGASGAAIGSVNSFSLQSSLAVAFDLHNNLGEGSNSVRLQGNGVIDGGHNYSIDLTPYGIDLHSGHRFHAQLSTPLDNELAGITIVITDMQTGVSATVTPVGIVNANFLVGYGYAGFTAGTGAGTATQTIYNWTYGPRPGGYNSQSNPVSYLDGFVSAPDLSLNGGATIANSALELTHGKAFEATSVLTIPLVPISYFVTDFDFNLGDGSGDGFTFVVQNYHHTAIGSSGGGLGYGPDKPDRAGASIPNSFAVKFDLHNNAGEGDNSTGLYTNGASPTFPAVDLTPSLNLHSGHTYHARLRYGYIGQEFPTVVLTIVDLNVYKVFETSFQVDVRQLPYSSIGFTAGSGATPSNIKILNWNFKLGF